MSDKSLNVWIKPEAYYTMSLWAELGGKKHREMTCFGRVEIEDGDLVVTEAYMIKHVGDSVSVDGDEDDIIRLMMELHEKGVPTEELRCWTHSHPGTGASATYLSGVDEDNIDRYLTGEFLVCIVFDSRGEYPYCRVEFRAGENERVSVEADLKMYIPYLSDAKIKQATKDYQEMSAARPVVRSRYTARVGKGFGHAPAKVSGKGSGVRYPSPPKVSSGHGFAHTGVYGGYLDDDELDWDTWGGFGGAGSARKHEPDIKPMRRLPPPRVTDVRFEPKGDGTVDVQWDGDDGSTSPADVLTEQSDDDALAALDEDETIAMQWQRHWEERSYDENGDGDAAVPSIVADDDTGHIDDGDVIEYDDLSDISSGFREYFERELIELCHQICTGEVTRDEAINFLVDDYRISPRTAEESLEQFLGVGVQ